MPGRLFPHTQVHRGGTQDHPVLQRGDGGLHLLNLSSRTASGDPSPRDHRTILPDWPSDTRCPAGGSWPPPGHLSGPLSSPVPAGPQLGSAESTRSPQENSRRWVRRKDGWGGSAQPQKQQPPQAWQQSGPSPGRTPRCRPPSKSPGCGWVAVATGSHVLLQAAEIQDNTAGPGRGLGAAANIARSFNDLEISE